MSKPAYRFFLSPRELQIEQESDVVSTWPSVRQSWPIKIPHDAKVETSMNRRKIANKEWGMLTLTVIRQGDVIKHHLIVPGEAEWLDRLVAINSHIIKVRMEAQLNLWHKPSLLLGEETVKVDEGKGLAVPSSATSPLFDQPSGLPKLSTHSTQGSQQGAKTMVAVRSYEVPQDPPINTKVLITGMAGTAVITAGVMLAVFFALMPYVK